jgi:hypothetical protein
MNVSPNHNVSTEITLPDADHRWLCTTRAAGRAILKIALTRQGRQYERGGVTRFHYGVFTERGLNIEAWVQSPSNGHWRVIQGRFLEGRERAKSLPASRLAVETFYAGSFDSQ